MLTGGNKTFGDLAVDLGNALEALLRLGSLALFGAGNVLGVVKVARSQDMVARQGDVVNPVAVLRRFG